MYPFLFLIVTWNKYFPVRKTVRYYACFYILFNNCIQAKESYINYLKKRDLIALNSNISSTFVVWSKFMNHLKQGFNDGHIKCYFKHQVPYINHMYETITFIMCEDFFQAEENIFCINVWPNFCYRIRLQIVEIEVS